MHPAPSVILFTTASGAGFGLLIFLGLGLPAVTGWAAFGYYFAAFALAVGGLLSSTFHLGHPERAVKAFRQWRSSWLSREGVAAVAALGVMGIVAIAQIFAGATLGPLGWLGAALSLATVYCTAMIYTQLTTIPRWNTPLTPALFVTTSLAGGALMTGIAKIAIPLLLLAALVQVLWWMNGKKSDAAPTSTLASATGLGTRGTVRSFAPPHTSPNYLMKEFMFTVGRRHSRLLRVVGLVLGFLAPAMWMLPGYSIAFIIVGALIHLIGIATSRWLFFAEARHVVGIYYGQR